jgi:hypothetical protein
VGVSTILLPLKPGENENESAPTFSWHAEIRFISRYNSLAVQNGVESRLSRGIHHDRLPAQALWLQWHSASLVPLSRQESQQWRAFSLTPQLHCEFAHLTFSVWDFISSPCKDPNPWRPLNPERVSTVTARVPRFSVASQYSDLSARRTGKSPVNQQFLPILRSCCRHSIISVHWRFSSVLLLVGEVERGDPGGPGGLIRNTSED